MDKAKQSKILKKFFFALGLMGAAALILALVLYGIFSQDLPQIVNVSSYKPASNSKVFAQNGELIAEYGGNFRIFLKPHEIPEIVKQAFIASEDKNFYSHYGIDFFGVIKAVIQSAFRKRQSLRGASTITQQLAKGLLIEKEGYSKGAARTFSRKIKEAILARRLEKNLSKEEILWIYLNDVYLGQGSFGVAAAAWAYFRKPLNKLTVAQLAVIAGLPQAPSRYSPIHNPKLALARQHYVLSKMLDEKFIDQNQHDQAIAESKTMTFYERKNSFRQIAPYFSEQIRKDLVSKYGEKVLYEQGLNIFTSLNIDHQQSLQKSLRDNLTKIAKRQGYLGPLYKAEDKELTANLIKKVNEENLLSLPHNFFIALVKNVDVKNNVVELFLGSEKGYLPLAGMLWAREVNPQKSYTSSLLSTVKGVLSPDDVIVVKKTDYETLSKNLNTTIEKEKLKHLFASHEDAFFSLELEPKIEGAMISVESGSGYVTALTGGYSFARSEFNRFYQSCRQPGSAFKPVVYLDAIETKEYTPASMLMDTPLTFRSNEGSSWKPKNFGEHYKGEVTLREALINSMNVPTLNLASAVGIGNILSFAQKLGIKTPLKNELGTAIGSSCVTPNEIERVFSLIANQGVVKDQILIKEIIDRDENRLFFKADEKDPFIYRKDRLAEFLKNSFQPPTRIISKESAYTMHYLLSGVAKHGTAARTNALGYNVAGKTGTTNDSFDTWFAGYAKSLTTVIWVGFDDMKVPLGVYEQGARTSLPLFMDFITPVLAGLPDRVVEKPESMCTALIDSKTGFRVDAAFFENTFEAPFICGKEPVLLSNAGQNKTLDQVLNSMDNF